MCVFVHDTRDDSGTFSRFLRAVSRNAVVNCAVSGNGARFFHSFLSVCLVVFVRFLRLCFPVFQIRILNSNPLRNAKHQCRSVVFTVMRTCCNATRKCTETDETKQMRNDAHKYIFFLWIDWFVSRPTLMIMSKQRSPSSFRMLSLCVILVLLCLIGTSQGQEASVQQECAAVGDDGTCVVAMQNANDNGTDALGDGNNNNKKNDQKKKKDDAAGTTEPPCKDNHELCNQWQNANECYNNPVYMLYNCPVTCQVCGYVQSVLPNALFLFRAAAFILTNTLRSISFLVRWGRLDFVLVDSFLTHPS